MTGNVFLRSFPTFAAVFLAAGVAAAQPSDEATEKAKAHFEAARRLYKQASYREAIAEFQKAYNLVPNAASSGLLLYNIANCHEKLAEVPQALRAYKDYLRAVPNADDRNEVLVTISNLEKRLREKGVQQVRVYSTPGGAQVAINGDLKGNTPFSIEIAPGKYFLTLTKKGYRPVEKDFVILADSSLELDFTLNEVKLGEVAPPPDPPPPAKVEEKPAPPPAPAAGRSRACGRRRRYCFRRPRQGRRGRPESKEPRLGHGPGPGRHRPTGCAHRQHPYGGRRWDDRHVGGALLRRGEDQPDGRARALDAVVRPKR